MKRRILLIASALFCIHLFDSCSKEDALSPVINETPKPLSISFQEDSIAIYLPITAARAESIGSVSATDIEGKLPDSVTRKNNIIIRVTGDSARVYSKTEVLVNYTDSTGTTYASNSADTINKVILTRVEKKKNGLVEGSFTIRVSNSTKTKTLLLSNGKISTAFSD